MRKKLFYLLLIVIIIFLTNCNMPATLTPEPVPFSTLYASILQTLTPEALTPNETIMASTENETATSPGLLPLIFFQEGIPKSFIKMTGLDQIPVTQDLMQATIRLSMSAEPTSSQPLYQSNWFFVLAAPFYSLRDQISFEELSQLITGNPPSEMAHYKLLMTNDTKLAIEVLFGDINNEGNILIVDNEQLQNASLTMDSILAVIPFENLTPQWKVLRIDGQSPIEEDFTPEEYPLSINIILDSEISDWAISWPASNYDSQKRTTLVMTGVTALTRATAYRMEINGILFPGQDIRSWLTSADITHISNEVPFAENCPYPDPVQPDLVFCSNPEYIKLLDDVGADIIELSGNHLLDYGLEAINLTLEMYESRGWQTFAGGWNIVDAQSPALIEHNGNKLAFLGCNLVGPARDWATDTQPGSAACGDFSWMKEQIPQLRGEGYIPIISIQYAEDYTAYPSSQMESDFNDLAEAGAAVIIGSQAHTPKIMVFNSNSFIHYGLGNLFFDQMAVYYSDVLMTGTRDEFIDRLIFYDGKLISIELLTAELEDYARPRPMTLQEREAFLSRIFQYAPSP